MWQGPKALVTTKPGKSEKCVNEILNKILLKDVDAKVVEYVKNVLVIYSNLDPLIIYGMLFSSPPSCAEKIYPFQLIINTSDEREIILNSVVFARQKLKDFKKFYVKCYNRGIKVNCKEIEIGVGIGLKDLASVDFKDPEVIVHINVLNSLAGVSILKKGQEKFRTTLSNKI
ncbi:THUMP domain-containing protein [Sulfolobus tengchongensis]|uniref:THUMP domain-containing protein n=1 Tax=Sulfolobus tengchongensis TaxID=207809 RepID=A0AAX4L169_9CREN